jgi:hypothetical protein
MTMMNTKTVILAAVTALTLGASAAMAQELGPSFEPGNWSAPTSQPPARSSTAQVQTQGQDVQYGSSDRVRSDNESISAFGGN